MSRTHKPAVTPQEKSIEEFIHKTLEDNGVDSSLWTVKFNNTKNTLGSCYKTSKRIIISRVVLHQPDIARKVALHEVAHALAPNTTHGPEWQKIAKRLGTDPTPYTKFVDASQKDETVKIHTVYGDVEVTFHKTRVTLRGIDLLIVSQSGKKLIGLHEPTQKKYDFTPDMIHENYGNIEKMLPIEKKMKTERGVVTIITGKSKIAFNGQVYTAFEPRRKNIVCFDTNNTRVLVPAHYFLPSYGLLAS